MSRAGEADARRLLAEAVAHLDAGDRDAAIACSARIEALVRLWGDVEPVRPLPPLSAEDER